MIGFVKIFLICFALAGDVPIEPQLISETDNDYCQIITVDPSEYTKERERIVQGLLEIRDSFFTSEATDADLNQEEFKGIFVIDTKLPNQK
jgi:hypothetical protein